MDVLQLCAQNYAELCNYTYDCTIARKNTSLVLTFSFSPYEFRHLAGLHQLKHPHLHTNSERLFKEILAGKITLSDLQKASNWKEKEEKIRSRLGAFSQLKRLMDEFLLIYEFSGEKLARQDPPIWTKIEADYLVKFALEEGKTFYFSVEQKDTYCRRSIFINDEQDYSTGQTKFTLLEKTRTNQQTGKTELLYRKETYKNKRRSFYALYYLSFTGRH